MGFLHDQLEKIKGLISSAASDPAVAPLVEAAKTDFNTMTADAIHALEDRVVSVETGLASSVPASHVTDAVGAAVNEARTLFQEGPLQSRIAAMEQQATSHQQSLTALEQRIVTLEQALTAKPDAPEVQA